MLLWRPLIVAGMGAGSPTALGKEDDHERLIKNGRIVRPAVENGRTMTSTRMMERNRSALDGLLAWGWDRQASSDL